IEATEPEVTEAIAGREAELSIAAINSPTSVVISGSEEAALQLKERFESQGQKTKRLAVSHAFHSPLMEPMLQPFAALCQTLPNPRLHPPQHPDRRHPTRAAAERRRGNPPRLLGRPGTPPGALRGGDRDLPGPGRPHLHRARPRPRLGGDGIPVP